MRTIIGQGWVDWAPIERAVRRSGPNTSSRCHYCLHLHTDRMRSSCICMYGVNMYVSVITNCSYVNVCMYVTKNKLGVLGNSIGAYRSRIFQCKCCPCSSATRCARSKGRKCSAAGAIGIRKTRSVKIVVLCILIIHIHIQTYKHLKKVPWFRFQRPAPTSSFNSSV